MSDALEDPDEPVTVAQGPFARLREVQQSLARDGVAAELLLPPGANPNA